MNTTKLATTFTIASCIALASGCAFEWNEDGLEHECTTDEIGEDPNQDPNADGETCPAEADAIYISKNEETCTGLDFSCPEDFAQFDDACGCGCAKDTTNPPDAEPPPEPACPAASDTTFMNTDRKVCDTITFSCPEGSEKFDLACGCGCEKTAAENPAPDPDPACPALDDPNTHWVSQDAAVCDTLEFTCENGCIRFDSACGCGCIE